MDEDELDIEHPEDGPYPPDHPLYVEGIDSEEADELEPKEKAILYVLATLLALGLIAVLLYATTYSGAVASDVFPWM